MAYQTSDIVAKVQQRVRDTSYSASEIKNYLNDAQNDVFNEYRLKFMKTSVNYTVSVGVSDITNGSDLPTNYVEAIKLINTTGGQEHDIPYIDQDELDEMYPDNGDTTQYANGQPEFWYEDEGTIRLFPAPADEYTLKLRYWKKPTILSADSDVPEIPSEFEEILLSGASYRVLQVKDNYDQAGIHENKYDELVRKLVAKYTPGPSGSVRIMPVNRGNYTGGQLDSYNRIRR